MTGNANFVPALHCLNDFSFDRQPRMEGIFELARGGGPACEPARERQPALGRDHHRLNAIAHRDFERALFVLQLVERDHRLALATDVDERDLWTDGDDRAFDRLASGVSRRLLRRLEHRREIFVLVGHANDSIPRGCLSKTLLTEGTEGTEATEDLGFGEGCVLTILPKNLPRFFRVLRPLRVLREESFRQAFAVLLLNHNEPPRDDRTLRPATPSCRRWRRSRIRWWRRSPLGLEKIRIVRLGIDADRLRPRKRRDRRRHRVLVGRLLMRHRDIAFRAVGNIDELLLRIPSQSIHARAVRDRRNDFARIRIHDDGRLVQPEKIRFDVLSYAMPVGPSHGASGHEAVAFHVLVSMTWMVFLPSLLTKMCPLPSAAAPSGAVSSSSTVATTSPVVGSSAVNVPIGLV